MIATDEEIEAVCRALIQHSAFWEEAGTEWSGYDKYVCKICWARVPDNQEFTIERHSVDCLVRLAQRILDSASVKEPEPRKTKRRMEI